MVTIAPYHDVYAEPDIIYIVAFESRDVVRLRGHKTPHGIMRDKHLILRLMLLETLKHLAVCNASGVVSHEYEEINGFEVHLSRLSARFGGGVAW